MTTQVAFTVGDTAQPIANGSIATQESMTATGTSAATTAAATADRTVARVATDAAVYVSFGSAPNATTDTVRFLLLAGTVEWFRVKAGDKMAAVTA